MDPTTLIVTALTVGATFVAEKAGGEAAKDAYHSMKNALKKRFADKPQAEMILAESEKKPEVWKEPLRQLVSEENLDKENDILEAAKLLLRLTDPDGASKGKYNVTFEGTAQGTVIGDHSTVTQTFGGKLEE